MRIEILTFQKQNVVVFLVVFERRRRCESPFLKITTSQFDQNTLVLPIEVSINTWTNEIQMQILVPPIEVSINIWTNKSTNENTCPSLRSLNKYTGMSFYMIGSSNCRFANTIIALCVIFFISTKIFRSAVGPEYEKCSSVAIARLSLFRFSP